LKFRVLEHEARIGKGSWYEVQYHIGWWRPISSNKYSALEDAKQEIDSCFDEDLDKVVYEIER